MSFPRQGSYLSVCVTFPRQGLYAGRLGTRVSAAEVALSVIARRFLARCRILTTLVRRLFSIRFREDFAYSAFTEFLGERFVHEFLRNL